MKPLPAVARAIDAVKPGAPQLWDDVARQYLHRHRGRRRGRDRRRLRPRRACRPARNLDATRHRRADGAAHLDRRLRRSDRRLHALRRQRPRRRQGASTDLAAGPRRGRQSKCAASARTWAAISARAISSTRNMRCCRGRRGASAARSNGPASGANRFCQRLSGPRPHGRSRTGARRGRQFPRAARHEFEQSRRARRGLRVVAKGHRPDVERLSHPGRVFPRPRARHQHGPDHALSQRRPARGDLRHRAAGRSRGRPAAASIRSSCAAAT